MNILSDEVAARGGECSVRIVDPEAVARVSGALPNGPSLARVADIFRALADPTRMRLLLALTAEPLCVCDLAEVAGSSESAVSHQLRVLRDLRLVEWERDGKRAVYRLADDHVRDLLALGLAHASERDER
jgi:ArsR family transcriptional regulator, lead/cadmium/zinc/bismuth-responsive transcriptional repressor